MSRTEAQIAASRRNGAQSRGPVTAAGKAKAALNATKHGLWSRKVVLRTEDADAFAAFRTNLAEELGASDTAALELVDELASARWRLDRVVSVETALLNLEIERLEKEQEDKPEAERLDGFYLGAVAFRNLHDEGILRHVHRQEARLRRMVDQLTHEFLEMRRGALPADETNPAAARLLADLMTVPIPHETQNRRNEPEPPRPAPLAPKQKRPTYDKDGRRIHYPDEQRAA